MKLAVIGGGAIGLLVSSYLQRISPVTLFVRRMEQKEAIERNGLVLQVDQQRKVTSLKVELFESSIIDADYIFIASKQYDLPVIMQKLIPSIKPSQSVIFLQNGMQHLKYVTELNSNQILFGIVEHGALKLNDFTVEHTGVGTIKLAPINDSFEKINELLLLSIENFPILKEANYYEMMSKKLIVNAVINPLTAILKVPNGELNKNEYFKEIVLDLIEEISVILSLNKEEMVQHVIKVIEQTDKNRSSMLKDLDNRKRTEIDSILGFLIEEAQKKSLPYKQIHLLYLLVKGLESEV